jgi:hypothetical protein
VRYGAYRVQRKPRNRTHAQRTAYVMRGALEASAPAAPITSAVRRASACVSGSPRSLAAQSHLSIERRRCSHQCARLYASTRCTR